MLNAYDEVNDLVTRARHAQRAINEASQREVDELAASIIYTFSRKELATEIAHQAFEETQMGAVQSKIAKLADKLPAVFYQVKNQKTVGIIEQDPANGITKIAKPIGVIGALIPSTNPEATPIFNAVLGLRARNALVFAPHPGSKATTKRVVDIMRGILAEKGWPQDLLLCIETPTKEKSRLLMGLCDLNMATGSGDMVKAAYSSGRPAYGVGAGNAVIVVDGTADPETTAEKIRIGKTGDHASGCSAENALVIQDDCYDRTLECLQREGGYILDANEKVRLQGTLWRQGALSRDIIARPASFIAEQAGITVPEGTQFLIVEETGVGADYPFSGEKLSVVLTVYRYGAFEDAINLVNRITQHSGYGHSCGIHSTNQDHILALANQTRTSRVLVRQPHGAGNSGNWFNGLPNTFSLGCGTWGGNITTENISQKHFMNVTWVAEPIDYIVPDDHEIYGDLITI